MRLDIADLHLFLCIVDAGSITRGAASANLALASASERLRNIEADAGVPLLERRRRGVVTTEAGDALAHHARLILHQQGVLKDEMRGFAAGRRGTLRLYANTAASTEFLPRRLAPWLARHAHLRVELRERTSVDIVRAVASGLAEAGIVSDAVDAGDLRLQPLSRHHLSLIVPPAHRLAERRAIRFGETREEPFVGLPTGDALQEHVEAHARRAGRGLDVRIRMKTFEGMCEMVSHGIGVGIVPSIVAGRLRRRYRHRTVALLDDWARRNLCLCYAAWSALSPSMQDLSVHLGARPDHDRDSPGCPASDRAPGDESFARRS